MRRQGWVRLAATVAGVCLLTTSCLSEGDDGGSDGGGGGKGDGKVEIFGAFSGAEEAAFNQALKQFETDSGIDVQYVASSDFTTLVRSRVQGGNPPEIALFPQPGLVLELARGGDVIALDDVIDLDKIKNTLIPGFLDATTNEGKVYGAPMRMAVKSIVWYPVPEFEAAGYTAPTTWAELEALTNKIKSDGNIPWCLGAESGADTGWVFTDWTEEMVLRTAGPDAYDKWVKNETPFDDPAVKEAVEMWTGLTFPNGNTLGGRQGMLTTPFGDAANPMFDDPPGCFLHRQGNFITGFFPEDVQNDLAANVGTFVLPPVEGGFDGTPILGGGDLAALFDQNDEAVEVMEFLTSDAFGDEWAKAGGWLSPHKTFDTSLYPDEITQTIAKLAAEGDVFRFDGSDLMPASVGAGTFWSEMVALVSGQKDIDEALKSIDESWPSS